MDSFIKLHLAVYRMMLVDIYGVNTKIIINNSNEFSILDT